MIQLRFWENPIRSFLLALVSRRSTNSSGETLASPTRSRLEFTGSQEGGTEAQESGAEGKPRVSTDRGGRRRTTTPATPCELRRRWLAGSSTPLSLLANGMQERALTRILANQRQYRGGGSFLTTRLALGKKPHFNRSCRTRPSRARRLEPKGAAAYPKAAPRGSGSPRGAHGTSPGAGPGAGPGLVVELLVIHHGGHGGR